MSARIQAADANDEDARERRRGRPRSERAHRAILEAALSLLVEEGYDAMSIESIAVRAGVGKATIYRRWGSKEDLVADALGSQRREVRVPDSGDAKEDVISLLTEDLEVVASPFGERALAQIIGAAAKHPRFKETYWRSAILPRREALQRVLKRAKERKEVREDADLELAIDLMVGPLLYRMLVKLDPEPSEDSLRQAVEAVWQAITTFGRGG
jgi:AcrR family transcriptional regulator